MVRCAGVGALEHGDAVVVAQAPVQLAVGDVERHHVLGSALEQAVGEAAGRGADVEGATAPGVDREHIEGIGQLASAARDEGGQRRDVDLDVLGDELPRLLRPAPARAEQHLAGEHGGRRAAARGEHPALREQRVEAELGHPATVSGASPTRTKPPDAWMCA